jgi:hypothetical protein
MVEKSSSTVSFSKLIDTILLSVCVVAILQTRLAVGLCYKYHSLKCNQEFQKGYTESSTED